MIDLGICPRCGRPFTIADYRWLSEEDALGAWFYELRVMCPSQFCGWATGYIGSGVINNENDLEQVVKANDHEYVDVEARVKFFGRQA